MNNIIVYRKQVVVEKPHSDFILDLLKRACRVVMALMDCRSGYTSALHLGNHQIVSYHDRDFRPHEAVIGSLHIPVKAAESPKIAGKTLSIKRDDLYHLYDIPLAPDMGILPIADKVIVEDLVFQIGMYRNEADVISFGTVERATRHLDDVEHPSIQTGSESGSALFTSKGSLLGMTLGHVSPDVMLATPITELLRLEEEPRAWFLKKPQADQAA